jgi:hypothetical protein
VIILGVIGIGGSSAAFAEDQGTSMELHGVNQLEDSFVYHAQKATEFLATDFGIGNTITTSNVPFVASIIQLWIILNSRESIHGNLTQSCKNDAKGLTVEIR